MRRFTLKKRHIRALLADPYPLARGEWATTALAATPFVNRIFTRDELGAALGHDQIVYAGFKPHP